MLIPFEDVCWIFNHGYATRGLCRLSLEEAAYLYGCVKRLENPHCVEIGRYFGGSTILLLSAGAYVLSIDNYSKAKAGSIEHDAKLMKWAQGESLEKRLQMIIGDSRTYDTSDLNIDILFVDGSHYYEGVKRDLDNWLPRVKGDIFFHDSHIPGVKQAIEERDFKTIKKIGSLLHVKT